MRREKKVTDTFKSQIFTSSPGEPVPPRTPKKTIPIIGTVLFSAVVPFFVYRVTLERNPITGEEKTPSSKPACNRG